jgi:hypothetical protein
MIPLSQEQQDDVLMSKSVMDEPRSTAQALKDFFLGRTVPEMANNTFSGGGVGQFLVKPGTPAKGVTWFKLPQTKSRIVEGKLMKPETSFDAAQGKIEDLIKVFDSKGPGTLWYDPMSEVTRYTDKMHEHAALLDQGNALNSGPAMSYGRTSRVRFEDPGVVLWPAEYPTPYDTNGIQPALTLKRNSFKREQSANDLAKMLKRHGLLEEPAQFGGGIKPLW